MAVTGSCPVAGRPGLFRTTFFFGALIKTYYNYSAQKQAARRRAGDTATDLPPAKGVTNGQGCQKDYPDQGNAQCAQKTIQNSAEKTTAPTENIRRASETRTEGG
jgi:hypothetical protein